MEKKSEFQVALEGVILLVAALFATLFHVLKWIPESDTVLFSGVTVFDLAQMALKACILLLFWKYSATIGRQFHGFYSQHMESYPATKSDWKFFVSLARFVFLIFIYELFHSLVKGILVKAQFDEPAVTHTVDILFVLIGIVLLWKSWMALQTLLGDISAEKAQLKAEEEARILAEMEMKKPKGTAVPDGAGTSPAPETLDAPAVSDPS
jgi:hypothetical protein